MNATQTLDNVVQSSNADIGPAIACHGSSLETFMKEKLVIERARPRLVKPVRLDLLHTSNGSHECSHSPNGQGAVSGAAQLSKLHGTRASPLPGSVTSTGLLESARFGNPVVIPPNNSWDDVYGELESDRLEIPQDVSDAIGVPVVVSRGGSDE
jgi:hypothetical protein